MENIFLEEDGNYSIFIYITNILDAKLYKKIHKWLQNMNDFVEGETSYNKKIPRVQKWYHLENKYFSEDWIASKYKRWISHDYDEILIELQNYLQEKINGLNIKYQGYNHPKFNSCLINKYRDGNDSIKRHSDNQSHFGDNPTILGLSLGENRTISFERRLYDPAKPKNIKKHKDKKDNFTLNLESNSLFIMAGSVQKYFTHEIKKDPAKINTRYNLTFREHH